GVPIRLHLSFACHNHSESALDSGSIDGTRHNSFGIHVDRVFCGSIVFRAPNHEGTWRSRPDACSPNCHHCFLISVDRGTCVGSSTEWISPLCTSRDERGSSSVVNEKTPTRCKRRAMVGEGWRLAPSGETSTLSFHKPGFVPLGKIPQDRTI